MSDNICTFIEHLALERERDRLLAENSRTTYLLQYKRIAELEARVEELDKSNLEFFDEIELQKKVKNNVKTERDRYRTALEEIRDVGKGCVFTAADAGICARFNRIATTALAHSNPSELRDSEAKCACGGSKYYSKPHPTNPDYVDRLYRCDCGGE